MSLKRKIITLAITALCLMATLSSRAEIGAWQAYMAYHDITAIEPAGNTVFVLASDNLYSYRTTDKSISTYDKVNTLSDVNIEHIAWCEAAKLLVIVYQNGNIDLLSRDGQCTNISDFYNKSTTLSKTVRQLNVIGSDAYLCTEFGAIKVNVAKAEVSETYNIGMAVNGVAAANNKVFLSTDQNGIYAATATDNLLNKASWQQVNANSVSRMVQTDGFIACTSGQTILQFDPANNSYSGIMQMNSTPTRLVRNGSQIIAGSDTETCRIASPTQYYHFQNSDGRTVVAYSETDTKYWCARNNKLSAFTLDSSLNPTTAEDAINPGGPKYNLFYYATFSNGILATTGGYHAAGIAEMQNPGTVQLLSNGEWRVMEDDITAKTGLDFYQDQNCVSVDPTDTSHVFAAGKTGLYEFRNSKLEKYYGGGTELITLANLGNGNTEINYVLTQNIMRDAAGDLWMLQSISSRPLIVRRANGTWEDHSQQTLFQDGVGLENLIGMTTDSRGLIWFVNYNWKLPAVFCYNPETKAMKRYASFINQDGATLADAYPTCVAEDAEHNIWVGTTAGPLLLYAADITSGSETFTQVKVPRNDGTNYADYLLSGLNISTIAIDGGNRKWFATADNGVYLISSDNMEQLQHFTAANSPLLDNNVQSVAINGTTGEVFFATQSGLCSYMSDASESSDEMTKESVWAYPNPVTPDYTGLITITGLSYNADIKITTTSGQLVAEGKSNGGTFTWDGYDTKGQRVASGVYHVLAATSEGKKGVVCRIAIVR